jgi:ribonuclease HII
MDYIIGIDEVGRGPIAGPVAVCAFLCKLDFFDEIAKRQGLGLPEALPLKLPPLKDSKKLSKIQREKWFEYLKSAKTEGVCDFSVSYVSPENIDKFGINACIRKALESALLKVTLKAKDAIDYESCFVYLDGGLKAPEEFKSQQTVIKGDELYPCISCASIIAKVSRDKVMAEYGKEYLNYGFENHAGYGTSAHYKAIKAHGLTAIHRKTFLK